MTTKANPQSFPGTISGTGAPTSLLTAPEGTTYYDTTSAPYVEYIYSGGAWVLVGTAGAAGVQGVAAGYKIARGSIALDGSNPTPIATGLATVVSCVATLLKNAAPGLGTCLVTTEIAGGAGNVNAYGWKPTAAGDCTLIASTGTETFFWIAVGT